MTKILTMILNGLLFYQLVLKKSFFL